MDRYERNKQKAKSCLDCVYLHIGQNADHNHCDKKYTLIGRIPLDDRANGHGYSPEDHPCRYKEKVKQH